MNTKRIHEIYSEYTLIVFLFIFKYCNILELNIQIHIKNIHNLKVFVTIIFNINSQNPNS